MKCEICNKDKSFWSEMTLVTRKDNDKNCYSVFHPKRPRKLVICNECLEEN
jgi:hypothetical protein